MLRRHRLLTTFAGLLLLGACSSGSEPPVEDGDDEVSNEDDEDTTQKKDASTARDASAPSKKDAGKDSGGSGKVDASVVEKGLPCEIAPIVAANCGECHGDKPAFGADFSLTSLADFQNASSKDEEKKIFEVASERVMVTGAGRMPPTSKKALAKADLDKLHAWLSDGAKSAGKLCPVEVAPPTTTGDAGVEMATPGSGGAHIKPIEYNDPELKCYPFTAFGKSDRKGKYAVPTNPDFYVAFMLKAPWQGTQYIRSFRGIIDNKDVIHHWLFFKNLTPQTDGRIQENALGAHPDGEMMFGWAPGGDDMYMDPDVGMAVSGSDTFLLEAHYNNKKGSPSPDASGVEVCVTPTKPKHLAGLTWVGTDAIAGTTASGVCAPTNKEPVRIFSAQPHMHTKGKNMKVVLTRKGGMQEVIHDEPFDFEYQRSYVLDVTVNPGDTLTTTCTFTSPATFGKGTSDEMCYFFTNSWPVGALTMPGIGTVIHGPNSCL